MTLLTAPTLESRTALTPEQFMQMGDARWMELVDGKPVEIAVSHASSTTASRVIRRLEAYVEQNPIGYVYTSEMVYRCFGRLPVDPDRMRRPDASFVRLDRFLALGDPNPGQLRIAPDLAVEVVSTHDKADEIDEKVAEYHDAGVPLVWVMYPLSRRVMVYPLAGDPAVLTVRHTLTAEPVLPEFACKVSDLFPAPLVEPLP